MESKNYDLIIIGAGLAGLSLAYYLRNSKRSIAIVEAANEPGGRIQTIRPAGDASHLEMGATWFGPSHRNMINLVHELGLSSFEQAQKGTALFQSMSFVQAQQFTMPDDASEPIYRIVGGSSTLINALVEKLTTQVDFYFGSAVEDIEFDKDQRLIVNFVNMKQISASKVVSTVTPQMSLNFVIDLTQIESSKLDRMQMTHTWMHDSIKFALVTDRPYWRDMGFSGTFFSQVGPVVEMYDHSNAEQTFFALKGFIAGSASEYSAESREQSVRQQLATNLPFYDQGSFEYFECLWRENPLLNAQTGQNLFPHQNNGHNDLREALIPNKLWLGGTETALTHPGYMDGAVERAKELAAILDS